MSFLERPFEHIGAARTSRDVCRDACAIERPQEIAVGHAIALWFGVIVLAVLLAAIWIGVL